MDTFEALVADDETLLARLLAPMAGEADARRFADLLLGRFGTLGAALAAPTSEIRRTLGTKGAEHAERLSSLHQLFLSLLRNRIAQRPLIASSKELSQYLVTRLGHASRQQFRVLHLDAGRHLILDELMWNGTVDKVPMYPREVLRRALELGAKHLILVHNHPSLDPSPSHNERLLTDHIVRAAKPLDITIIDHLIVTGNVLYSLRDEGLLSDSNSDLRSLTPREHRKPARISKAA